jgi:hypothetical protein
VDCAPFLHKHMITKQKHRKLGKIAMVLVLMWHIV